MLFPSSKRERERERESVIVQLIVHEKINFFFWRLRKIFAEF